MWSHNFQPEAWAERVAQLFGQRRIVNEDVQPVGVFVQTVRQASEGRQLSVERQSRWLFTRRADALRSPVGDVEPADDAAQVAVAGRVGYEGDASPGRLSQTSAEDWPDA